MKVFRKRYLFIILLVVLTIPIAINFVANHYVTESPAEFSAWLGFWGSYTGGILSGFITLGGVYLAFRLDRKERIRQSIYSNYETVLGMLMWLSDVITDIDENKGKSEWLEKKDKEYEDLMKKMIEEVNGEWAEDLLDIYIGLSKINKDSDTKELKTKMKRLHYDVDKYRKS